MTEPTRYTFGDTPPAAARLKAVAAVFNPLADKFLRRFITRPPASAADLGCGPGYTTDMLSVASMSLKTYGLDRSPEFLELARAQFSDYEFLRCDITKSPLPVRAQILYARSVLSHMADPVMLANDWAAQLPRAGLVFLHEVEAIETAVPVFQRYLDVNRQLIASQGAELFVGKALATGNFHFRQLANETQLVPVPTRTAASWFAPNVRHVWPNEPGVTALVNPDEQQDILAKLDELAASGDGRSDITWTMRWVVLIER